MVAVGDCFLIRNPANSTTHIYFVIAEQQDNVLLFNATTYKSGKDSSCILNPGDHDFIVRHSCISYENALISDTKDIINALNAGQITRRPPKLGDEILQKIIDGAFRSDAISKKHLNFLEASILNGDK